jgi:hypothetical protein
LYLFYVVISDILTSQTVINGVVISNLEKVYVAPTEGEEGEEKIEDEEENNVEEEESTNMTED